MLESMPILLWGAYNMLVLWSALGDSKGTPLSRSIGSIVAFTSFITFGFAPITLFLACEAFFWFMQMLAGVSHMLTAPPNGTAISGKWPLLIAGNVRAILAIAVCLI